ncbi:MAG: hydrogenase expression/formation protein HypE [Gemmatimonadetes bacterium]|nr:hydrogenase expression/formation protein HypE [Gemmatimonadota bacterium]MBK6841948.1 hydrogenase expression/formation protein HypE [Gemmatimonadota bacterium]MBK7835651.1 hydrogenase expression/formation protein HypE [Gemmatimonadota bacterium]MBK8062045.1 hydrogenase expression/formation protein HypE [Gemmatimonadota bacterium]MBK8645699.1 hydrogenase expression/formation protein HypE [Gemmatimonadota bacterium]
MGHGGGGTLSAELVEHIFKPAFSNAALDRMSDSAVVQVPAGRLAYSTDSFVVRPLFFPGGSIGALAVHGTVNDLAMSGATPLHLSAGFILEEGFPMESLGRIVTDMAAAARAAGVTIVTGDTKVVERGRGDGVYINTSGIGLIAEGVHIAPQRARAGDAILLSGTLGDHGMAIMSVREGLEFETTIESDCASLHTLVAALLAAVPDVHVLRDPTRGGLASALNEIASEAKVGMVVREDDVPVKPQVRSACELLGLDPYFVANEGKLLAIVPGNTAQAALQALRAHPLGADAAIIGEVTDQHPGMLIGRTGIGASRVITMQIGEQLPRIC